MIHFLVPETQDFTIRGYLDVSGAALRDDFCIVHYEDLADIKEFALGTYVLSALDQLSPTTANLLVEIHQQLKDIQGVRFLNNPESTLQRFELLTELHRHGLNEFRVARAGANHSYLRFPVFLRNERAHEGALSPLLNSERDVRQAIGRALVQGHKLSDLLVVEFCDTANDTGYFSKYAAFIVGKKVIPRSLNYGRYWMLKHSETEFTVPMVLEELDYVSRNPHQQQLLTIFELAHVEYGRIDYAIKNGSVQTWEINLNPTIGRSLPLGSPELDAIRDQVRAYFYREFESGWNEVHLRTEREAKVEVKIHPTLIMAARAKSDHQNWLLSAIRTVLRPAKPLIEPLSPPFLRLLSSVAGLFQRKH